MHFEDPEKVPSSMYQAFINHGSQWISQASFGQVALLSGTLLVLSNLFMTWAWYGHLKHLADKPWWWAALLSWGIALFEYLLQVPANRIGFSQLSLAQLKIMQEVITLTVFLPFSMLVMQEPFKLDYLWAGLCLLGAVYFIFRH